MIIREVVMEELTPVMEFYNMMCGELGKASFLPEGDKGGFPAEDRRRFVWTALRATMCRRKCTDPTDFARWAQWRSAMRTSGFPESFRCMNFSCK